MQMVSVFTLGLFSALGLFLFYYFIIFYFVYVVLEYLEPTIEEDFV